MTRPRGFAAYCPRGKARNLIEATDIVLEEYADHLPLTLRQVFYRLVVAGNLGKTEHEYARLCETMNRARRAGLLAFDAIRDDGFAVRQASDFKGLPQAMNFLDRFADDVTIDRQRGQEERLQVWCEAAGMMPQLESVASKYGIPVMSSGGFDSVTTKHDIAQELSNQQTTILHIGDHDPSGVHIFSSLAEDIQAFAADMNCVSIPEFVRIAVTPEQIVEYDLPTAPPKQTDNRCFSGETAQAEALPPSTLADILNEAITSRMDMEAYQSALAYEQECREALKQRISA